LAGSEKEKQRHFPSEENILFLRGVEASIASSHLPHSGACHITACLGKLAKVMTFPLNP